MQWVPDTCGCRCHSALFADRLQAIDRQDWWSAFQIAQKIKQQAYVGPLRGNPIAEVTACSLCRTLHPSPKVLPPGFTFESGEETDGC